MVEKVESMDNLCPQQLGVWRCERSSSKLELPQTPPVLSGGKHQPGAGDHPQIPLAALAVASRDC